MTEELTEIQFNILQTVSMYPDKRKQEIARIMNAPPTTVYDNLVVLLKLNVIRCFKRQVNKRGRPLILYRTI